MKTISIIIGWLGSLMSMATDNLIQGLIALCFFGFTTWLLNRNKKDVYLAIRRFEKRIDDILTKQTIKP